MNRLKNKVAIVTGAASGIGQASAILMAAEGAKVVVADFSTEGANATVEQIRNNGGEASSVYLDAMKDASIAEMVAKAREMYGGIHVLYNNVGGTDAARDRGIADLDWEQWHRTLQLNLNSAAYAARCTIPLMIESGGGSIINTTSGVALRGDRGPTAYAAAKGGIISLTRFIAAQCGHQRIRCNAISPGLILSYRPIPRSAALLDIFAKHTLVPYHGEPDDIAYTALFLASDESKFITGQLIEVDGGLGCHSPAMADLVELGQSGKPVYPPPPGKS